MSTFTLAISCLTTSNCLLRDTSIKIDYMRQWNAITILDINPQTQLTNHWQRRKEHTHRAVSSTTSVGWISTCKKGKERGKGGRKKDGPLFFVCVHHTHKNPMKVWKGKKIGHWMKDELLKSIGAQYATRDQWRNNSRKNEEMEPNNTQLWMWLVELEVVKQEMARVNVDILGISKLKWTGMGEFNSDALYLLPWARIP